MRMMKTAQTALLLTFVAVLAACSSGPPPEEVAKLAFEATVSADMVTAKPLYCPAMQDMFPSQQDMDNLQKELDVKFTFDFSGLTYALVEKTEDRATVSVSGPLVVISPAGNETLNYNETIPLVLMDGNWLVCEE